MFSNILVPIDLSHENSWQAPLQVACKMSHAFGARLHVMTVMGDDLLRGFYPDIYRTERMEKPTAKLEHVVHENVPHDVPVTLSVEQGGIHTEILQLARELPVDLIAMGSHRPTKKDYVLGSNASHIARHAPCSVLIVRDTNDKVVTRTSDIEEPEVPCA